MARLPTFEELMAAAKKQERREWQAATQIGPMASPMAIRGQMGSGPLETGPLAPEEREVFGEALRTVAPFATATAGTAIGGAVGGVPGAMVGGGAAELFNQAVGLSEPSVANLGLSVVAPAAMAGAGRAAEGVLKSGARRLPGVGATMHDLAKARLERLSAVFGPDQPADDLYAIVDRFNPKIPVANLRQATRDLLSKEQVAAAGLKLEGVSETATALTQRALPGGQHLRTTALPFQDIRVNLRRIGDKIRETRETGGEEHGAWKKLWKSLMDDLETAASQGQPAAAAVQSLKLANAAARRDFVADELADIMSKGGLTSRPDIGPEFMQVNFGRILDAIRKGKHADDIKTVLKPAEYQELVTMIGQLAKQTPHLPAPRGQFAGSAVKVGQAVGGGALGMLGATSLGARPDVGAAVGAFLATKGAEWLARSIMSDTGRHLVARMLTASPGGIISPQGVMFLGAALGQTGAVREGAVRLGEFGMEQMRP